MIQTLIYVAYSSVVILVLLYGLYCLLLPRWRARLSVWRLSYRIVMALRRKPANPVASWRVCWARTVGLLCLVLVSVWLVILHPQFRLLPQPLYDASVNPWQVENGQGIPEESRDLERLDEVTRSVLRPGCMVFRGIRVPIDMCVGMCVGVIHDDRTYVLRVGRKSVDNPEPPNADTLFEIGSITKTFTCAALASLVEEGVVRLEDPVAALLPGWTVPDRGGRAITLNDLATHRSGLPREPRERASAVIDWVLLRGFANSDGRITMASIRDSLADCELSRVPGALDEYSNLGVGLLGYALSLKTRQTYGELITERVLAPLEMRDSGICLSLEQVSRFAQGYVGPLRFGPWRLVFPMRRRSTTVEAYQGAGSMNSTVHDLLKYLRANIDAPDGPLGKVLARIQLPQSEMRSSPNCKIGLGMMSQEVEGLDELMYWHNGGTGGYNSFMGFCKTSRVGVVMLASGVCDERLGRDILNALAKD